MIWVIAIIVVVAIYNAERLPDLIKKFKSDVPHIIDAGKKMSKDLKEKAQVIHQEKTAKNKKTKGEETKDPENND
ncbi:MAG: hypothetical protein J6A09_04155 [Alphaproteobacteria bacterium]|nr:hypothetical protein [Alphaproteobacteria bacterium]